MSPPILALHRFSMSRLAELHRAEKELYRETMAYYAAIRRPRLEWTTFALAATMSFLVTLHMFGVGFFNYRIEGEWLTAAWWICLAPFTSLDTFLARARHPMPAAFFAFFGRIYEKFAMQERAWQLLVVLMLPVTARFAIAVVRAMSS